MTDMDEDLVAGIVGDVAGVMTLFQQSIKEAKDQTKNFGPALDKLQDTMKLIAPKIEELDRMNQQHHANISEEEIRVFIKQLEKGKELSLLLLARRSPDGTRSRSASTRRCLLNWIRLLAAS
ncbi:hypothetical protein Q3G72_005966 [Acer saccharum]|nr:hypothetical protein Q3G72_005966 [Acer saccharum]